MKLTSAIEASQYCDSLRRELSLVRYNPDLHKMLKNIEGMITEISKKEVTCRRSKNFKLIEAPLKTLCDSIDHLEKLILIARLME